MREGWLEGDRGEGNEDGAGRKIWVMEPGMGQIGMRISRISEPDILNKLGAGDRYYL